MDGRIKFKFIHLKSFFEKFRFWGNSFRLWGEGVRPNHGNEFAFSKATLCERGLRLRLHEENAMNNDECFQLFNYHYYFDAQTSSQPLRAYSPSFHEGHQDPCTPRWGLGQDWILGPSFPGCVVFWWPPWCLCQVCSRCFIPVCLYNQSRIVFRQLFPKYYCFFNSDFLSYDFLLILWSNNHR